MVKKLVDNKYFWVLIVVVVLFGGYFLFFGGSATVTAEGSATLETSPDSVSVYINAQSKNESAKGAKDNVNIISNKLVDELKKIGFEGDEIQILTFNVYENYEWDGRTSKQNGYIATQQILVKTEKFKSVPDIVDKVIDSGALVQSINFELSEERESDLRAEALERAGKDARKKADAIASGVGKNLGGLVSIQSSDFNYYPYTFYEKADAATAEVAAEDSRRASTSLAPRNIEVSASVRVEYRLIEL